MKKIITLFLALFIVGVAYSQSADVITEMLESTEVTYGQVCYLSAVHQGLVTDKASFDEAVKALSDAGQIAAETDKSVSVDMANLAAIYAKMWNVKGGLFYRLTKGSPRYSFKQLKVDGVLSETADPSEIVSGTEALNIYTSCSSLYGGEELSVSE